MDALSQVFLERFDGIGIAALQKGAPPGEVRRSGPLLQTAVPLLYDFEHLFGRLELPGPEGGEGLRELFPGRFPGAGPRIAHPDRGSGDHNENHESYEEFILVLPQVFPGLQRVGYEVVVLQVVFRQLVMRQDRYLLYWIINTGRGQYQGKCT